VSNAPDLQPYVVHEAWKAIRDTQHCTEKQPLTQVSCWCIGEYGAGLLNGVSVDGETITVSEQEVIDVYQKILWAKHMSLITKQYALMSVTKLSTRFPNATPKIQEIMDSFSCHMEIDLQQRGVEFSQLFTKYPTLRSGVLEIMDPIAMEKDTSADTTNGELPITNGEDTNQTESLLGGLDIGGISIIGPSTNSTGTAGDSLLDLIMPGTPNVGLDSTTPNAGGGQVGGGLMDLLGDLDMSGSSTGIVTNPMSTVSATNNALLDGLGLNNNNGVQSSSSIVPNPGGGMGGGQNRLDILLNSPSLLTNSNLTEKNQPSSGIPNFVGYDKNDISITFRFDRPTSTGLIVMNLNIVNNSSVTVTDFYLQAAVPKSMNGLEILAASSTNVEANGGAIQQVLKVNNPNKAELKLMLKVSCKKGGVPVNDQHKVDNFPAELTATH
jgi:AP-1 complex subunit gamma-1